MRIKLALLFYLVPILSVFSQWNLRFQTTHQQMVKVFSSPNNDVAWFITNMDSLYKTSDGGMNWTKLPPSSPSFNPDGLFVLNSDTAFKSSSSALFRTVDGGLNWVQVFSGAAFSPPVIWMKDSNQGLMAYNGQIYISTDAGLNWSNTLITQPPHALTSSLGKGSIWISDDRIWVTQNNGGVAYSDDFGQSWNQPANTGISFSGWGKISFANNELGLAVRQNLPFVYVTNDGGETWTASFNSLGANEDVLAFGTEMWFIPNSADHFYVQHSSDQGSSWQVQLNDPDGFDILEKSRNGNRVWAGSDKGKVYLLETDIVLNNQNIESRNLSAFVYPNPSSKSFTLNLPTNTNWLEIHSSVGEIILPKTLVHTGFQFGEEFKPGLYTVHIQADNGINSYLKIVKY